jgi:hypothetical protein
MDTQDAKEVFFSAVEQRITRNEHSEGSVEMIVQELGTPMLISSGFIWGIPLTNKVFTACNHLGSPNHRPNPVRLNRLR